MGGSWETPAVSFKRHLATNTEGLPQGIEMTTADVTDRDGAIVMVVLKVGHRKEIYK
jgi:hypothetical protein